MKPLIPEFIESSFSAGERQGSFPAVALFIDLTDFTPLTEGMMNRGKEGAEQLSFYLNNLFGPLVKMVYQQGGFVPYFAGDAFHGIFPEEENLEAQLLRIIKLGDEIRNFVNALPPLQTYKVGVKQGISFGEVEWGIVGKQEVHSFYFRGSAIDESSDAQSMAKESEIIVENSVKQLVPSEVRFKRISNSRFFNLVEMHDFPVQKIEVKNTPGITESVAKKFFPDSIIQSDITGEFRVVLSIFISFEGAQNHKQLDEFVTIVLQSFADYGGYFKEVDFGDKGGVLVGFFGAPVSFEDNDSRALELLCSLQEELKENPKLSSIKIRGGVTKALSFTGLIGGDERAQYAVVGSRVNLAARLMMKAPWGEIFADDDLSKNARFNFIKKGDFRYKGVAEPMATFILKGRNETFNESSFQGPMIGRKSELEKLIAFGKAQLFEGKGSLVTVFGEAGIGKSIFLQKVKSSFVNMPNLEWYKLQPAPILTKPFHSFLQFLKAFFEQKNIRSKAENRSRFDLIYNDFLIAFEEKEGRNLVLEELERTRPILAALVGINYENSVWDQLDAKGRFENSIAAINNLIVAKSTLNPLILELEDAQQLDENSQALLKKLVTQISNLPTLLLIAGRTGDDGSKPKSLPKQTSKSLPQKEFLLTPFGVEETQLMAEAILKGKAADHLVKLLQRTTNGNPFYIEQILQYFLETDILKKESGEWDVKDKEVGVSDSIQSILTARIDRLSNLVKETVKTAAVIGREFEVMVLSEVMTNTNLLDGGNGSLIQEQVRTGEQVQIWQAINELRYIFKHSLFREAVYDMQLNSQLKKLHRMIAEAIEKLHAGELEEYFSDLAFHYRQAKVSKKAVEYLQKAASQARENFQNKRAIILYEQLNFYYKKEETPDNEIKTLLRISSINELIGQWNESEKLLKRALQKAESVENISLSGRVRNELGRLYLLQGNYDKSAPVLEQSVADFKEVRDMRGIAKGNGNLGMLFFRRGKYEEAKKYLRQAIQLSRELDFVIDAQIISSLGLAHMNQGDFSEGIKELKTELAIATRRNDKRSMATIMTFLGIIQMEKEDHDDALKSLTEAFKMSESLGNKLLISITTGCLGSIYQTRGDFDAAMTNFDRDLEMVLELGDKQGISIAYGLVGELLAIQGDFSKAKKHLKKSVKISSKIGYKKGLAKAENNLGDIFYRKGKFKKAEKKYRIAVEISQAINNKLVLGESLLELAETLLKLNRPAEAHEIFSEANLVGQALGNPDIIFNSKLLGAKMSLIKGDGAVADEVMKNLLKNELSEEQQAELHFYLCRRGTVKNEHTQKAILLFEKLYKKTPAYHYKGRFEELKSNQ